MLLRQTRLPGREAAGPHRRRRRRRRPARARPQARRHHRRLRLGVGAGAAAAAPRSSCTPIPTAGRRAPPGSTSSASTYERFEAPGTSEDIAMLLAYENGAELIVAVGTHSSMVEFLDKGRPGMASTFLVRMKVGPILVDAKGVSRLYQTTVRSATSLLLVAGRACFTLVVVAIVSEPVRLLLRVDLVLALRRSSHDQPPLPHRLHHGRLPGARHRARARRRVHRPRHRRAARAEPRRSSSSQNSDLEDENDELAGPGRRGRGRGRALVEQASAELARRPARRRARPGDGGAALDERHGRPDDHGRWSTPAAPTCRDAVAHRPVALDDESEVEDLPGDPRAARARRAGPAAHRRSLRRARQRPGRRPSRRPRRRLATAPSPPSRRPVPPASWPRLIEGRVPRARRRPTAPTGDRVLLPRRGLRHGGRRRPRRRRADDGPAAAAAGCWSTRVRGRPGCTAGGRSLVARAAPSTPTGPTTSRERVPSSSTLRDDEIVGDAARPPSTGSTASPASPATGARPVDDAGRAASGHYGVGDGAKPLLAPAAGGGVTGGVSGPRERSVGRAAAGMGAITAVSRALGFVRVLVVAAVLGTTFLGNAFQSANSLSNVLFELLAAGRALGRARADVRDAARRRRPGRRRAGRRRRARGRPRRRSASSPSSASWRRRALAELLTLGVPGGRGRRAAGAHHLPPAVLPAPGPAVRGGHGRHRRAVRQAPLRHHRRRADRQHGRDGRRACSRSGPSPGPTRASTSAAPSGALLVLAGTGGVVAFVGSCWWPAAPRASGCGRAGPAATPGSRDALRHSGWGVVLHTGAGLLLGAAIVAGAGGRGRRGRLPGRLGVLPRALRRAGPAHPHGDPPRAGGRGRRHGRRGSPRSVRWALERMALLVLPVSAGMVALARPGHAAGGLRRDRRRGRRAAGRRAWPRWPSGCCPTAPSCCWPAATTPSATAARRACRRSSSARPVGVVVMAGRRSRPTAPPGSPSSALGHSVAYVRRARSSSAGLLRRAGSALWLVRASSCRRGSCRSWRASSPGLVGQRARPDGGQAGDRIQDLVATAAGGRRRRRGRRRGLHRRLRRSASALDRPAVRRHRAGRREHRGRRCGPSGPASPWRRAVVAVAGPGCASRRDPDIGQAGRPGPSSSPARASAGTTSTPPRCRTWRARRPVGRRQPGHPDRPAPADPRSAYLTIGAGHPGRGAGVRRDRAWPSRPARP